MANLLSSAERATAKSLYGDFFETFQREIVVHKSPKKVINTVNLTTVFGYGTEEHVVYDYQTVSGVYSGLIDYKFKDNYLVTEINQKFINADARIKVEQAAKDFIDEGRTERIDFDNKTFQVMSSESPSSIISEYYTFYLKEVS